MIGSLPHEGYERYPHLRVADDIGERFLRGSSGSLHLTTVELVSVSNGLP